MFYVYYILTTLYIVLQINLQLHSHQNTRVVSHNTSVDSVHNQSLTYISSCKSADGRPTLPTLRDFPGTDRYIDIAAEIGTDYDMLGTLLLNDHSGNKVNNIEKFKQGHPVDITVAILKIWIEGKGKMPVTWQTLVTCLRKTKLNVLASDIEAVLFKHNGCKDSDQNRFEDI